MTTKSQASSLYLSLWTQLNNTDSEWAEEFYNEIGEMTAKKEEELETEINNYEDAFDKQPDSKTLDLWNSVMWTDIIESMSTIFSDTVSAMIKDHGGLMSVEAEQPQDNDLVSAEADELHALEASWGFVSRDCDSIEKEVYIHTSF